MRARRREGSDRFQIGPRWVARTWWMRPLLGLSWRNGAALLLALVLLTGCGLKDDPVQVHVVGRSEGGSFLVLHDDARGVTCWASPHGGFQCVPDWQLERPDGWRKAGH